MACARRGGKRFLAVFGLLTLWRTAVAAVVAAHVGSCTDPVIPERSMTANAGVIPGSAPVAPVECAVRSSHSLRLRGETIPYTAAAGYLVIRDGQDRPTARIFYVAYTRLGVDRRSRPITFLFNGGPGSASLWALMDSFGPVRIDTGGAEGPRLVTNEFSLLDVTDLMFIDAPMTGYSRLTESSRPAGFAGIDPDIQAFRRIIEQYLTIYDRWLSPKYIFGESYGTVRAAGLTAALQADGVAVRGVILQSTVLNYNRRAPGVDLEYVVDLPSYAAIAWYFDKVPHTGSQEAFIEKARTFANGPYAEALMAGDGLSSAQSDRIANGLAGITGLPVRYIKENHLRIPIARFRAEILRNRGLVIGRYDARVTGIDHDGALQEPTFDPSDTDSFSAYVTLFHDYVATTLHFHSRLKYIVINFPLNRAWRFEHRPFLPTGNESTDPGVGDVGLDLGAAMRADPQLQVFSSNGLYDLGTPFHGAEFDLAHNGFRSVDRERVHFGYYQAGHMVYSDERALRHLAADLGVFYRETCRCHQKGPS